MNFSSLKIDKDSCISSYAGFIDWLDIHNWLDIKDEIHGLAEKFTVFISLQRKSINVFSWLLWGNYSQATGSSRILWLYPPQ